MGPRRVGLLWACVLALVCSQWLAVIHRTVHLPGTASAAISEAHAHLAHEPLSQAAAHLAAPLDEHPPVGFERLFNAHHDVQGCLLYDQLNAGDALPCVAALFLPELLPAPPLLSHPAWLLAAQAAGYLARGPPLA